MAATSEQESTGPRASHYGPLGRGPARRRRESCFSLQQQTSEFEYSYAAAPLRLSGSCVERRSRLCVKQKNYRKVLRGKRCVPGPES